MPIFFQPFRGSVRFEEEFPLAAALFPALALCTFADQFLLSNYLLFNVPEFFDSLGIPCRIHQMKVGPVVMRFQDACEGGI